MQTPNASSSEPSAASGTTRGTDTLPRIAMLATGGTIAGSAPDANGVLVEVSGVVTGAAPSDTAITLSGNIDGQMSVPAGGCSNNGHGWSLTPR